LPIIEVMKGLNCYASFCVASGTKKSLTLTQAKVGFFVPGDTVDVQRDLFFLKAVAGPTPSPLYTGNRYVPATVFLLAFTERT